MAALSLPPLTALACTLHTPQFVPSVFPTPVPLHMLFLHTVHRFL